MKNYQFPLVSSTYSAKDAQKVLLSLVYDKINFLNVQILSLQERFGSDTAHLEKRVIELKHEQKELQNLLNAAQEGDLVDIDCQVKLNIRSTSSPTEKEGVLAGVA